MTSEYDNFEAAMKKILTADPAKIKAQMEAEKQERAEKREQKEAASTLPAEHCLLGQGCREARRITAESSSVNSQS
jgi:hypothetical protein